MSEGAWKLIAVLAWVPVASSILWAFYRLKVRAAREEAELERETERRRAETKKGVLRFTHDLQRACTAPSAVAARRQRDDGTLPGDEWKEG